VTGLKTVPLAQYYAALSLESKARPKGIDDFALSLRASVRGLWNGSRNLFGFVDNTISILERHLENAWREGANVCGIRPDERSPEEQATLQDYIENQIQYVLPLGQFIQENSRENGGLLRKSLNRLPPWINRYNEVREISQEMSCTDQKFVWLLGEAEHCISCLRLNGRVMRMSKWRQLDVHPQDTRPGKLRCRGFE
jgi:hypothetical protein